jgi:hypothetical protein
MGQAALLAVRIDVFEIRPVVLIREYVARQIVAAHLTIISDRKHVRHGRVENPYTGGVRSAASQKIAEDTHRARSGHHSTTQPEQREVHPALFVGRYRLSVWLVQMTIQCAKRGVGGAKRGVGRAKRDVGCAKRGVGGAYRGVGWAK